MRTTSMLVALAGFACAACSCVSRAQQQNLLPDPSIEEAKPKDRFGNPFAKWGGYLFEGSAEFRNGLVARTGKSCAEIVGGQGAKIRLYSPAVTVEPGRYRFSCYIRGLDIGKHEWGLSEDLNFADDQYYPLKKTGTFGWTRLEIVKDVPKRQEVQARVGLWAPGRLWIDDAELVRVGTDTPLTATPALGKEEKAIAPPGNLDSAAAVRCPECGYRNMPAWGRCYACGAELAGAVAVSSGPDVKPLVELKEGTTKPFEGSGPNVAESTREHAANGSWALRLNHDYVIWNEAQDWSGYDFVKADVFNAGSAPTQLYFEVHDRATNDYWTRVNYNTVIPPGASTLVIPADLYVGEKSRPGRALDKAHVTMVALNIGEAKAPVFFSKFRLERDLSDSVHVPGLMAYSFGPGTSPPLRGFTAVTPGTVYTPGRGFGLKDAKIWRTFDVLQPDPLYENIMCIEGGGFSVDLPDGRYHVFVNLDSPSGFWGEYQVYRQRIVKANGVEVVHDTMDLQSFLRKYFRFADVEDSPDENTFDKYQRAYFQEKEFDVDVRGGRLDLEFLGENWANSVSALVLYPASQADAGRKYLDNLRERRRFWFDNYFKRVLPDGHRDSKGAIPEFVPTDTERAKGYTVFARDWMEDVPVNGIPRREEVIGGSSPPSTAVRERGAGGVRVFAAAGQLEPLVFSVRSMKNLGQVQVSATDLIGPGGAVVPASAIRPGVVSHRITRVTAEGSVYTISPRLIMPRSTAALKKDVTTTFWLTIKTPATVKAGIYRGRVNLRFADGKTDSVDIEARLFATPLDELDVPAGPWGSRIDLPWPGDETAAYNRDMYRKCLAKMREYGCTSFSGIPEIHLRGWKDGKPDIDFTAGDQGMADARAAGFHSMVVNYNGGIQGFDNYFADENAMKAAGFATYADFLRPILAAVDAHARSANWLPVAYNLCDEPLGDTVPRSVANAKDWREAAPAGILTTGATSVESPKPDDPHLQLAQALKIANLNGHDDASIRAIKSARGDWAFYNGGNRWTFGAYMYKCAKEYGMKFRLSWHWNACAGDPYYALDCREDDYAWCTTNAKGELIPSIHFDRDIRAGIDDYRAMLTLSRLIQAHPNHPAAAAARKLLADKLASFKLGEREHDAKWPAGEYRAYRLKLLEAIEQLHQ